MDVNRKNKKGIFLLEHLIALSIGGLLLFLAYYHIDSSMSLFTTAQERGIQRINFYRFLNSFSLVFTQGELVNHTTNSIQIKKYATSNDDEKSRIFCYSFDDTKNVLRLKMDYSADYNDLSCSGGRRYSFVEDIDEFHFSKSVNYPECFELSVKLIHGEKTFSQIFCE